MPLAADLRPRSLADFVGQHKLLGDSAPLRKLIEADRIPSMLFWGPPGSGKTTLAEIIAHSVKADFLRISAVVSGKEDLKKVLAKAQLNKAHGLNTILFIDEIHRWNKAQQDALLPFVETGEITLIGATTENPSFSIISPLLSRARVFVFETHSVEDIKKVLLRGLELLGVSAQDKALEFIAQGGNGDIRFALNALELAADLVPKQPKSKKKPTIDLEVAKSALQKYLRYDKSGEEHYNLISAVHKSLRSSNADGAAYWVLRMLAAGEDPLYIARRLVRFASEDIGNANPNALLLANLVYDTCHKIGMPECETALLQLVEYLAKAPKNNSAYVAGARIKEDIEKWGNLEVPLHLRNAPTKLMKDLGYAAGYEYDHDLPNKKSAQQCLPDKLAGKKYFP